MLYDLGRLETGKPNVNGAEELNSLQKPDESYLWYAHLHDN